jgi:hypothetical protein
MKVFVLGTSYSGKTPVAARLGAVLGIPVYSAGKWARRVFGQERETMADYVREVTEWSLARLREDFKCGLTALCSEADLSRPNIIEGERNPYDFVQLFDPAEDLVIGLAHTQNPIPATTFELGLDVIWSYLDWLLENRFIQGWQSRRYNFDCLYVSQKVTPVWTSLEERMDEIVCNARNDWYRTGKLRGDP